jgi:hypothetical protein
MFARWSLPVSEAKCLRLPSSADVLELLAPYSGVPELLPTKVQILGVIAGRCLTTSLSLLLAATSTAGSLLVPLPHDGVTELTGLPHKGSL